MLKVELLLICMLTLGCSGCVSTHYAWKNYDGKLYRHYKNPADQERFLEDLQETIIVSEASDRVPPGLYAEYGYALYETGKYADAIFYFQKENDKWPESRVLMSKMIKNVTLKAKPKSEETKNIEVGADNK